jgi:hypothetical protein
MVSAIFQIPQRFELVYGTSALQAGVRLVPYTVGVPLGSVISTKIVEKLKVPVIFVILAGACLQIIGFALLATLPITLEIPHQIYAYEIVASIGYGMNITMLILMIPYSVGDRDRGESCIHLSSAFAH